MITNIYLSIITTLLCLVIVGAMLYLAYPFIKKLKYHIRTEKLATNRRQRRVEKQFEKEYNKNLLPVITEDPLIVENFPKTLEIMEEYSEEGFGGSMIFRNFVLPIFQIVSQLNPSNPTEQKITQGAGIVSSSPVLSILELFNAIRKANPPQPKTATDTTGKAAKQKGSKII